MQNHLNAFLSNHKRRLEILSSCGRMSWSEWNISTLDRDLSESVAKRICDHALKTFEEKSQVPTKPALGLERPLVSIEYLFLHDDDLLDFILWVHLVKSEKEGGKPSYFFELDTDPESRGAGW